MHRAWGLQIFWPLFKVTTPTGEESPTGDGVRLYERKRPFNDR